MYEEMFSKRLTQLRMQRGVSAREISIAIGQSCSYINRIENHKMLPSMTVFFYICDYFGVTPREFFDDGCDNPILMKEIINDLLMLDEKQLENIAAIIKDLKK